MMEFVDGKIKLNYQFNLLNMIKVIEYSTKVIKSKRKELATACSSKKGLSWLKKTGSYFHKFFKHNSKTQIKVQETIHRKFLIDTQTRTITGHLDSHQIPKTKMTKWINNYGPK